MTASVHYIRFPLSASQTEKFERGPVVLAIAHPDYRHHTVLSDDTRRELWADLDR
jgi:hypothetical protein